jgi:hypothetical protein
MEHAEALDTNAVERYLLDEMNDEERAIFEEHYFDCSICGPEVVAGTRMLVAGRDAVTAENADRGNVVPIRPGWSRWVPQAAAAAILFAAGYLIAPRSEPDAPTRLVKVVSMDLSESRAEATDEITHVRSGDVLRFDIPHEESAEHYVAEVRCGDKVESRQVVSREKAAEAVSLQLGELPAARCELAIEGVRKDGNRSRIAGKSFRVVEER